MYPNKLYKLTAVNSVSEDEILCVTIHKHFPVVLFIMLCKAVPGVSNFESVNKALTFEYLEAILKAELFLSYRLFCYTRRLTVCVRGHNPKE